MNGLAEISCQNLSNDKVSFDLNTAPSRRILAIDDELHIREVLQVCLEMIDGWNVIISESGVDGLLKAETNQPDAILLDIMMPGMDGLMVLKELQNNPSTAKIPVILLTAKSQLVQPEQVERLGVKIAIAKPFNPITLPLEIANSLGWILPNTNWYNDF